MYCSQLKTAPQFIIKRVQENYAKLKLMSLFDIGGFYV